MKITFTTLILSMIFSIPALSHDGGHGPKVVKTGKYGGSLTKVSQGADRNSAKKSEPLYAAELVKDDEGKVSIYLYSKDMKPMSLKGFSDAKAAVESGRGKRAKKQDFSISVDGMSLSGKLPKKIKRPFNIIVNLKKGSQSLFMAFDNLD